MTNLNLTEKLRIAITEHSSQETNLKCSNCHGKHFPNYRYKCLTCQDLSICETCFRRSAHQVNHPIVRLNTMRLKKPNKNEKIDIQLPYGCLVNKFNIQLYDQDLSCLDVDRLLNGNIIDFYLHLMCSSINRYKAYAFSSLFFHKFCNVYGPKYLIKSMAPNLGKFNLILVPTCFKNHWRLIVMDLLKLEIIFYDSLNLKSVEYLNACQQLGAAMLHNLDKRLQNIEQWRIVDAQLPQQLSSFDCGVFVCLFARFYAQGLAINFDQKNVKQFRIQMRNEILNTKLFFD